jgi:hypothetical protein
MHFKCCSIATKAQKKVVELKFRIQGCLNHEKNSRNDQVMHILMLGNKKTHPKKSLIT